MFWMHVILCSMIRTRDFVYHRIFCTLSNFLLVYDWRSCCSFLAHKEIESPCNVSASIVQSFHCRSFSYEIRSLIMQYRSCRIEYYLKTNACLIAPWLQLSCSALDIPSGKKLGMSWIWDGIVQVLMIDRNFSWVISYMVLYASIHV